MTEGIYTFSDEELAEMFKRGQMKVLTTPTESVRDKTEHEKALEKAKRLFGDDFEDVFTLEVGGKSGFQLLRELESNNCIGPLAKVMLSNSNFTTFPQQRSIELVKLRVEDLNWGECDDGVDLEQIYNKAKDLGLISCPVEVGARLVLNNQNSSFFERNYIAMEPIILSSGEKYIFYLYTVSNKLFLSDSAPCYMNQFTKNCAFIFGL